MDILKITAEEIMSKKIVKVYGHTKLGELQQILAAHRIAGVPVVDDHNKLIGVVSGTDVVHYFRKKAGKSTGVHSFFTEGESDKEAPEYLPLGEDKELSGVKVADIMTPSNFSFKPTVTVKTMAQMMTRMGVHRVFVTSQEFELLGLVSSMDLVRVVAES